MLKKMREMMKKIKNSLKEGVDEVLSHKTKSQVVRKIEKCVSSDPTKDVPYPLVPSKKEKESHFAKFQDMFKQLETIVTS